MGKEAALKVVKTDKLTYRVKLARLIGRERFDKLMDNKSIEVSSKEYEILKKNWVKLKEEDK